MGSCVRTVCLTRLADKPRVNTSRSTRDRPPCFPTSEACFFFTLSIFSVGDKVHDRCLACTLLLRRHAPNHAVEPITWVTLIAAPSLPVQRSRYTVARWLYIGKGRFAIQTALIYSPHVLFVLGLDGGADRLVRRRRCPSRRDVRSLSTGGGGPFERASPRGEHLRTSRVGCG